MAKTVHFFGSIFITALIFISCQKDPTEPLPEPEPGIVGNFSVQLINRQPGQANISWTVPTVPAGSVLKYKVYLAGVLQVQDLSVTSYTLSNVLGNQVYNGKVVAYTSATDSSVADFTIPVFTAAPSSDSMLVLLQVTDANGLRLDFAYDEANKRLSSWSTTYNPTNNYDSTKIYYDATGKILSLVRRKPEVNNSSSMTPLVFEYDAQGRVSKLYYKYSGTYNASTYAFLTTVNYPIDFNEVASYDSLNYDALNRVTSVYNLDYPGPTPNTKSYRSYHVYTYSSTNDSLLSKIDDYLMSGASTTFTLTTVNFNAYNNKANPYYQLFKKIPLMGIYA